MVEQLKAKPGADRIQVTLGDFANARVPGKLKLAYLVYNTISDLTTQDDRVAASKTRPPTSASTARAGHPATMIISRASLGRVSAPARSSRGLSTLLPSYVEAATLSSSARACSSVHTPRWIWPPHLWTEGGASQSVLAAPPCDGDCYTLSAREPRRRHDGLRGQAA